MTGTVTADLEAEGTQLERWIVDAGSGVRKIPTPAAGWTVAHQVGHLTWTDEWTVLACTDPEGFGARMAAIRSLKVVDEGAAELAQRPDLLELWRAGRGRVVEVLRAVPEGTRLPWFGPPMSATSMATARLMETWAHGLDVADGLGVTVEATPRLRHVAHLGVRTRDFAYSVHGLEPPAEPFRVELSGPGGELWAWGPADAGQRVTGPALDFCLLVTQRRHRDDLSLQARGVDAERWLGIAQAFAGAPGAGRPPLHA